MPALHYRSTARAALPPSSPARHAGEEGVFVTTFAVFWLVSLVRVIGAVLRHEVFGGESTLAVIVLVAVPWLLWARRPRRPRGPRLRARSLNRLRSDI